MQVLYSASACRRASWWWTTMDGGAVYVYACLCVVCACVVCFVYVNTDSGEQWCCIETFKW
jgi:hypothetical protein